MKTENQIREEVRREWREETSITQHRKYPQDSWEALVACDEGNKILFND